MIYDFINEGARFYVAIVGSVRGSETITQTANTARFSLPQDCIQVERVSWVNDGVNYVVSPTTIRELDERMSKSTGWENDFGVRAEWYYIFGVNEIGLYPKISSGTQTYTVHYKVDLGAVFTGSSDDVPDEDREALVHYAVSRCLAQDRKVEEAAEEYQKFSTVVKNALARRSSIDRMVRISSNAGWQNVNRITP